MKTNHLPGQLKIMADPEYAGMHPYHDHRYVVTADAEIALGHDPRPGNWELETGSLVCVMRDVDTATTQRLVACWNACEGINPEAVPELLAALEEIARRGPVIGHNTIAALTLRITAMQSIARAALAKAKEGA
jgi:hypothetical protein